MRREPRDLRLVRGGDPALCVLARRVELDQHAERRVRRRAVSVERVGDFGARERLDRV